MPSSDDFGVSGPHWLVRNPDWTYPYHRTSIAACLVKGTYVLERDRLQSREGTPLALGPPWWESFAFRLHMILRDTKNQSYFGAVYEYMPWRSDYNFPGNPPRFVISFRGTIKSLANLRDLKIDFLLIFDQLRQSSRFQHGLHVAQNFIIDNGADNVWLAGHSKGSAIALLVGKKLFEMGYNLQTYLFNPPFPSTPKQHIKNEMLKNGIGIAKSVITAGLAAAFGHQPNPENENRFTKLSAWNPYLFVNPSDYICSVYISYFELRDKMESIGAGTIGRLATQHTIFSLLTAWKDSEPSHLLPSAYLTINSEKFKQAHGINQWWKSRRDKFKQAHGINQWWDPDIHCSSILYQFK